MAAASTPYQPNDVLLYGGTSLVSRLIQIKTWSRASHCEIIAPEWGNQVSTGRRFVLASRDGIGVGAYVMRADPPIAVHRLDPKIPFNATAAETWFWSVNGQGYDWLGLLSFYWATWQGRENNKQFCSEFLVRYLREGIAGALPLGVFDRGHAIPVPLGQRLASLGLDPWNGADADSISPSMFATSPLLVKVDEIVAPAWGGK